MGITTGQLKKLGFNIKGRIFKSEDHETMVYKDNIHNLMIYLPRGKKVLFYSYGFDPTTGEPLEHNRLVFLDEVGYFEMLNFLRSLKRVAIKWPKKMIVE